MVHACDPNTQEEEAKDQEFKASLGYVPGLKLAQAK